MYGSAESSARRPGRVLLGVLLCGWFAALPGGAAAQAVDALEAGDRAWTRRAETLEGERAAPAAIEAALGHYRAARAEEPTSAEAYWKLIRALQYASEFVAGDEAAKAAAAEEAISVVRAGGIALDPGGTPDADRARVYFWSSIGWGMRANRAGLLTLVREGIARRMHDDAERALALDPSIDDGGPLRLLARLHAGLPKVPFVTGWVDRDKAVPYAERALSLFPRHPGNRLVLALTLLDVAPDRAGEARALLEGVSAVDPRADFLVEDLSIREQARTRLEALPPRGAD